MQVGQKNLVGSTGQVNQTFLAAVISEVQYAESRGLVVALNDQWQLDGHKFRDSMPTKLTEAFWGSLASHFGKDPQVVFDLYNEPEQWVHCGWRFWHRGGRCGVLVHRHAAARELRPGQSVESLSGSRGSVPGRT